MDLDRKSEKKPANSFHTLNSVRRHPKRRMARSRTTAGAVLLLLCLRSVAGGWRGGSSAPRRRAAEVDHERYIVTICPEFTPHEAHEQLATIGLHASRNYTRLLRGIALEGVNAALHQQVR